MENILTERDLFVCVASSGQVLLAYCVSGFSRVPAMLLCVLMPGQHNNLGR